MRIVLAPDKFKGSLDAAGVAAALADGVREAVPDAEIIQLPLADGGEGSVECALAAGWRPVTVAVTGPLGAPVTATFAISPDGCQAMVEMASASGLALLPAGPSGPAFDALRATSRGTGELILAALDHGCRTIVLAVGGSASTDGGAGIARALGAELTDKDGLPISDGGGALADLARVDVKGLDPRLHGTTFVLAADVTNPLLGRDGAAAVFGPQKGASPDQVAQLDAALARWAHTVADARPSVASVADVPGAGAAGGVGFAALALLGASMRPGAELMLNLTGFDDHVAGADLVVTGEGSLDAQSLSGKTPVGVAARAQRHGVPTVAVCGRNTLSHTQAQDCGFETVYALLDLEPDPRRCIGQPVPLLRRLGATLAEQLSATTSTGGTR